MIRFILQNIALTNVCRKERSKSRGLRNEPQTYQGEVQGTCSRSDGKCMDSGCVLKVEPIAFDGFEVGREEIGGIKYRASPISLTTSSVIL